MKTYDFIFSLGAACSCSQTLRLANLQFASFPFDWLYGGTITTRVDGLLNGLEGWFDASKLVRHSIGWKMDHEPYRNTQTGIVYKHDFDWNTPLEEMLLPVRLKYERRIRRLHERIAGSKRVLAVWINTPTKTPLRDEELVECRRRMSARWPGVEIELLALMCERGRPYERRVVRTQDGVTVVDFDYYDEREEFIDNELMAKRLAVEFSAEDYRSDAERREWPAKRRRLKYAQYNATGWWQYVVNRTHYRLYRHFKRWIERKGLNRLG